MSDSQSGKNKWLSLLPYLTEKQRRIAAAVEARSWGYGGVSAVAKVTGLSRTTLQRAIEDLTDPQARSEMRKERGRVAGGGRKKIVAHPPSLLRKLQALGEPAPRGAPRSPLLWTAKSTRPWSEVLSTKGRPVGPQVVARALPEMHSSRQANAKTLEEGAKRPNRESQLHYLNPGVSRSLHKGDPVSAGDSKKKELLGPYHNKGREGRPPGEPEQGLVHDCIDPDGPKAMPYGGYEVGKNAGGVKVGGDHDTATFAMESLRRWWRALGAPVYPEAQKLLICADSGGSTGYRSRLWQVELQQCGEETGLEVAVCHVPPGTSKWNKIAQRVFSHISMNWSGRPLVSHAVVVQLIGKTKTKTGLKVNAKLDKRKYPTTGKVSDEERETLHIEYPLDSPNPEWHYTSRPRNQQPKK